MPVKIVIDSSSDVPPEVADELGITIIPMAIVFGTEVYHDGVDLTTEQFYQKLAQAKTLPTTAAPPLETFATTYDNLAEETDEILVIAVSRKFSVLIEVATLARGLMKRECRVEVIDSLSGTMGAGLVVIAAAKAAGGGASLDDLIALTRRNIPRSEMRMAFDTLEYLKRGGRIGRAQAFMGSLLKMNPILGIKDGEAYPYGRERSRAKAIDHLYRFATGFSHIDEMAVEDATTPDEAERLVERLDAVFPKERIYRSKVSPVVGAHVGPHILSVAVLGDRH